MTKDFMKYLTVAPVLGVITAVFAGGLLIEINRFLPDLLFHP